MNVANVLLTWPHMVILFRFSQMANVSFGGAYVRFIKLPVILIDLWSRALMKLSHQVTEIIAVLRIPRFYHNEVIGNNIGFQLTMALSSQMIGYTLAGLTREYVIDG
jgi:hypothetical protein